MKIGFIGAGVVAQTIARHVLPFGHRVLLSNKRGPDSLASVVKGLGTGAEAGTPQQAAEQDIVVLAVNWPSVQAALFSVADWKDRILVDATNRVAGYNSRTLRRGQRLSKYLIPSRCPGSPISLPRSRALFCSSLATTTKPKNRSTTS